MTAAVLLAAETAGGVDYTVFAQFGAVGAIAIMGIWFAKGAHQREKDRSDRLEAENARLHEMIIERVIPAMTSATAAAQESADLLAAMQRERELSHLMRRQEGGP